MMTAHPGGADHARMAADDVIRFVSPALSSLDWTLSDLIDEVLFSHGEWRHEAAAVEQIYRRWSAAHGTEREHLYGAYIAALDQEEAAAMMYATVATEIRALLQGDG
jgi:hypothetical protein